MEVTLLIYTTSELKMCEAYARIAHPADYNDMYHHICNVSQPYGNEEPAIWIKKMVARTTVEWEKGHPEASAMIQDILYDSGIKHLNFR